MTATSAVLRHAARGVERREYAFGCVAINASARLLASSEQKAMDYYRLVGPEPSFLTLSWWWSDVAEWPPSPWDCKIVGLCLAAAIAESEGD